MKLVSGGTGAAKVDGGAVEKRLNPLQCREAATLLTHHILQELAHHLVDGGPSLGRHRPSLAQEVFFDDQGNSQSLHLL